LALSFSSISIFLSHFFLSHFLLSPNKFILRHEKDNEQTAHGNLIYSSTHSSIKSKTQNMNYKIHIVLACFFIGVRAVVEREECAKNM